MTQATVHPEPNAIEGVQKSLCQDDGDEGARSGRFANISLFMKRLGSPWRRKAIHLVQATVHPETNVIEGARKSSCQDDADGGGKSDYANKSLFFIPLESPWRKRAINLVAPGSKFHSFILLMILLNTISMSCVDYRYVDEEYVPRTDVSRRNFLVEKFEIGFNLVFVTECILKVVAHGFVMDKGSYLRDHWNKLDFLVVLFSVLGMIPGIPNLTIIRTIRVLRPLRSISKLPGLRRIIGALVESIGSLANVVLLLTFVLTCFSIMGVLFWNGILHGRCRLTPFPVEMSAECRSVTEPCWEEYIGNVSGDPDAFRCLPDDNDNASWTPSSSPWFWKGPQDCIWPIDTDDDRICSLTETGIHSCPPIRRGIDEIQYRTCGSNYDAFGNSRFHNTLDPYGFPRMESGVFSETFNWGYTNFDDFFSAFMTTFQIITLEGWADVLYHIIDAWSMPPTVVAFVILITLGGYITLNLVLAVITGSLDGLDDSSAIRRNSIENQTRDAQNRGSKKMREIVMHPIFSNFVMVCIVVNTIILSLDHFGISDEFAAFLEGTNVYFTAVFTVEMCFNVAAYGMKQYFADPPSVLDAFIVVTSIVEFAVASFDVGLGNGFTVFRSLRLFRIFKLARRWKSLHSLLHTMYETVLEIGNFVILLLLFMHISALIGMQFFSNRMRFQPETGTAIGLGDRGYEDALIPRSNFDSLPWSMVTIFQVLSGEDWHSVMYDCRRAASWTAVIYFLVLVVIGVFIVMNLFLAILLKKFYDGDELLESIKLGALPRAKPVGDGIRKDACIGVTTSGSRKDQSSGSGSKDAANAASPEKVDDVWGSDPETGAANEKKRISVTALRAKVLYVEYVAPLLRTDHPARLACLRMVEHWTFDRVVIVFIIMSSINIAVDNPLADPNTTFAKVNLGLGMFFSVMFALEAAAKIAAYGLISPPQAYLRNAWNIFDFVVVLSSVLDFVSLGPGKALRVLKSVRVLRPIRMISRVPRLKLVVDAFLLAMPAVGNVAVICTLFFLVFAIFGVTYLKGTFYHCDGAQFSNLSAAQTAYLSNPTVWGDLNADERVWFNGEVDGCHAGSWTNNTIPSSKDICDCLAPGEWVPVVPQNFNNVLSAMALLFEIATTEGWIDVMIAAIDQRGINAQPARDSNPFWALFFISFIVIGSFFVLELFVGVIIDTFNKIRDENGRGLMTQAQKEWASTQAFIMSIKPEKRINRPATRVRRWCYDLVMPGVNPNFDRAMIVCIVLSSVFTAMTAFGDSQEKTTVLEAANVVFTIVFATEAALKIFALDERYFHDRWNVFDFILVCGTVGGLTLGAALNYGLLSSVIRTLRIARLFRLIKAVKGLRVLFNTMVTSIPSIVNIGSLLLLLFFVYAVCGVQLYSKVASNGALNHQANFRSIGNGMLLLFRFSTGEDWNGFMRRMMIDAEGCDPDPQFDPNSPWCLTDKDYPDCTELNGCSGGSTSLFLYFYSFTLMVSFVILNLFVGVVLDSFDRSAEGDILSTRDLDTFTTAWAEYDPDATWFITTDDLKDLVTKLPPPLNFVSERHSEGIEIEKAMKEQGLLDIPVNEKKMVNIVHVATYLTKHLAKEKLGKDFVELDDDHPLQQRIVKVNEGTTKTLHDVYLTKSKNKLSAIRAFASTQKKKFSFSKEMV